MQRVPYTAIRLHASPPRSLVRSSLLPGVPNSPHEDVRMLLGGGMPIIERPSLIHPSSEMR